MNGRTLRARSCLVLLAAVLPQWPCAGTLDPSRRLVPEPSHASAHDAEIITRAQCSNQATTLTTNGLSQSWDVLDPYCSALERQRGDTYMAAAVAMRRRTWRMRACSSDTSRRSIAAACAGARARKSAIAWGFPRIRAITSSGCTNEPSVFCAYSADPSPRSPCACRCGGGR